MLPFCRFSICLGYSVEKRKSYKDVKIVTKNQFGVHIFEKKNPATEKDVLRYIPFSAMNAEFLRFFPFCDGKVIDRLDNALRDRKELIEKRFKDRLQEYAGKKDYVAAFNGPAGANVLHVFMVVTDVTDTGSVAWIYTDTQEALFYGKVFVQDLITDVGAIVVNDIYPDEKNSQMKIKDIVYPSYTIHSKKLSAFEMAGKRAPSGGRRR